MTRMRLFRTTRGLKQCDVAKIVGMERTAFGKLERGFPQNVPPADALIKLRTIFDVGSDWNWKKFLQPVPAYRGEAAFPVGR